MRHISVTACGFFLIALAACQPNPPVVTPTPPTATLVGAFVPTRIATQTNTPTPTLTLTHTATFTASPTNTNTPTPTPSPTRTSTPTLTRTPTLTPTATSTPTLTLTPSPTPTSDGITRIQVSSGPTPIAVQNSGFTYEGEISDESPRVSFVFEGEEGEIIGAQLQLSSGDLDPYLLLTNASGEIITENDDDPNGIGRDSYIRDFELPQTGRYFITATRFEQEDGDSEGDFVFTFERSGDSVAVATTEPTAEGGDNFEIACEQTLSQTIGGDDYRWRFTFSAQGGQVVSIRMVATSGDLDSIVRLLNADGDILQENDDDPNGIGKDAFLRDIEIPADGTYIIEASRFQDNLGTTEGDFDISLTCTNNGA